MLLRDELEYVLRAWNSYELSRNGPPVIDFDCNPIDEPISELNRLSSYAKLVEIRRKAIEENDSKLIVQVNAHETYLRALMGMHIELDEYVESTQGCHARGWPEWYIQEVGKVARQSLEAMGVAWNHKSLQELSATEHPIENEHAADAIEQVAKELEITVRNAVGTTAPFKLTVESVDVDAYWDYWTDGVGESIRVRLNLRQAHFTEVLARQFAIHEVLGHGLQAASLARRCASGEHVSWTRVMSVHAPQQVAFEGLAQTLPLFILPDDQPLMARVRLDHYIQLVQSTLHVALGSGSSIESCAEYAHKHVPYWSDDDIAKMLADRGADPTLRSYLWAYPAGIDWFINLLDSNYTGVDRVFAACYQSPLTPMQLASLWPEGPPVGGSGHHANSII